MHLKYWCHQRISENRFSTCWCFCKVITNIINRSSDEFQGDFSYSFPLTLGGIECDFERSILEQLANRLSWYDLDWNIDEPHKWARTEKKRTNICLGPEIRRDQNEINHQHIFRRYLWYTIFWVDDFFSVSSKKTCDFFNVLLCDGDHTHSLTHSLTRSRARVSHTHGLCSHTNDRLIQIKVNAYSVAA